MKKLLSFTLVLLLVSAATFSQQRKLPPMNGAMPRITSTAWTIYKMYKPGNVPAAQNSADVLVFCKVKSWDLVPGGNAGGGRRTIGENGTFRTAGNTLTLINGSDKKAIVYKMTWNAATKILKLEGGGVVFEMFFNGVSDCDG